MEACINKIIQASLVDGPGCRTAIFLQGCNMECIYCHNPETQNLCGSCGVCVRNCPSGALSLKEGRMVLDQFKCLDCQHCIKECSFNASPKTAYYNEKQLFSIVNPYQDFIEGVTFSGGECSLQFEFIISFAEILHKQTELTLFLDTNGLMENKVMRDLMACTDGFMFDLKAYSPILHRQITKADNFSIKDNMALAAEGGKLYEVRLTLLEDLNDQAEELLDYFHFIESLPGFIRLKLIPFSPFGVKGDYRHRPIYPKNKYEHIAGLAQSILGDRIEKVCYNWRK